MFGRRRRSEPTLDPAVERIEELLSAAASRHPIAAAPADARYVLTICACVTAHHSPNWVIFGTDGGIGWHRSAPNLPNEQVVSAPREAGGHADPADVLAWLQGEAVDPWASGDGFGDVAVYHALQRWIVSV